MFFVGHQWSLQIFMPRSEFPQKGDLNTIKKHLIKKSASIGANCYDYLWQIP